MKKVQCLLKSKNTTTVCWIDNDPRLKQGIFITLKDTDTPERRWEIITIGVPREMSDIKGGHSSKDWHKNDKHTAFQGIFRNL